MERILLPVDGSALSAAALPTATILARAQGARVDLVRVVAPQIWATQGSEDYLTGEPYEDVVTLLEQEAKDSLEQTAGQLRAEGIGVDTHLMFSSVAASLLDLEARLQPNLVVMATHGRTGLARFALGSIANLMVRQGTSPVLLVRSLHEPRSKFETALVPLDGSALAEEALPIVEMLAGKPLRHVHLLRAIASSDEEARAVTYLEQIATRLQAAGLTTQLTAETTAPADAIAQRGRGADVVILSTHGRGGFDRLRHGSVAEEGTRYLTIPTLLVRAGRTSAATTPVHATTYVFA